VPEPRVLRVLQVFVAVELGAQKLFVSVVVLSLQAEELRYKIWIEQ
jgi:hypothetical protein